jgi:hypothetical protein
MRSVAQYAEAERRCVPEVVARVDSGSMSLSYALKLGRAPEDEQLKAARIFGYAARIPPRRARRPMPTTGPITQLWHETEIEDRLKFADETVYPWRERYRRENGI